MIFEVIRTEFSVDTRGVAERFDSMVRSCMYLHS
jgi:hypothetical protein